MLSATSTFWVALWHAFRAGSYRKAAGVDYPASYADSASISAASAETKQKMIQFNCAQRAHANFLESQPSAIAAILLAGLRYPVAASAVGLCWSIFRIVYAVGYTLPNKPKGSGRYYGILHAPCQLALFVMAGLSGYKMLA